MKTHRFFVAVTLFLLCSMGAYAIGSESVTMNVGETKTLKLPSSITSLYLKSCVFTSTNTNYVSIKSRTLTSVTVVAKKACSSEVTVTCNYIYYVLKNGKWGYGMSGLYNFRITVKDIPATSIELPETQEIQVGTSMTLKPTITPSDATSELSWSSDPYYIINVDKNGKILAQRSGTAVVTVTTSNGLKASCKVTAYRQGETVTPDLTLTDKQDAPTIPAKANVTYSRTFYSGWNSLCVPFAVKASYITGCKLAVINDMEVRGAEKYFSYSKVNEVAAGTPCLVWVEKDTKCSLQLDEQALAAKPVSTGIMKGSYSNATIGAGCYKLSADGSSFSVTESKNAKVTAYRTYIILK